MNVNYLEATFGKRKVGDTLTFTLERRTNIGERAELKKATITNNLTEKKTTSFLSICLLKKVNRKRVKGKLSSKRKKNEFRQHSRHQEAAITKHQQPI